MEIGGLLLPPMPAHYDGVVAISPEESDDDEAESMIGMSSAHLQLLVQMLQSGQLVPPLPPPPPPPQEEADGESTGVDPDPDVDESGPDPP